MSSYSAAERHEILRQARANVAERKAPANGSSAGLVYKTNHNAIAAADGDGSRAVSAKPASEMVWWEWVNHRFGEYSKDVNKAVGQALSEFRAQGREHTDREVGIVKRECELMRRELATLRTEVELKLNLQSELAAARADVEELRQRAPNFEAEVEALREQVAKQEKTILKLRVEARQLEYAQRQQDKAVSSLRREAAKAAEASVEMELETSTARFKMRNLHPDAAAALQEFASRVVDSWDGRTIGLLSHPAGTA